MVISGGRNYSLAHAVKVFTDKLLAGEDAAAAVSGSFDGTDTSRDYRLIWTDEFDTLDISQKMAGAVKRSEILRQLVRTGHRPFDRPQKSLCKRRLSLY